jgi:hypothetical protein
MTPIAIRPSLRVSFVGLQPPELVSKPHDSCPQLARVHSRSRTSQSSFYVTRLGYYPYTAVMEVATPSLVRQCFDEARHSGLERRSSFPTGAVQAWH